MKTEKGRKYLCCTIDDMIEALQEIRDDEGNLFVEDEQGVNQVRLRTMLVLEKGMKNEFTILKVY